VAETAVRRRGVDRRRLLARVGLVAGGAVFLFYLGLWAIWIQGGSEGSDYTAFYTGWTIVAHGDGANLYDPEVQAETQKEILGGRSFQAGLNPFNNPPHAVVPFLPLTALPLNVSYIAWAVIQVGLLGWLLWRLVTRVAMGWSRDERILLIAAGIAAPPLALALLQGSFSLLVTVALLEVYLALCAGGERAAAAWLVVASVKPQAVLTTGVALVAARRWGVVGLAAGGFLLLALLATVVMGPGIWPSYLRFLGDYIGSFDVFSVRPSVMWNFRGTLSLWAGPDITPATAALINQIALIAQIAALVAVAWLWRGRWDAGTPAFALRFAMTLVIGLVFSPHLNPHDDLLLVPAGAMAYGAVRERPEGPWLGVALLVAPFAVLVLNWIDVNQVGGPLIRVPVILMLAFIAALAVLLREERRVAQAVPAVAR
jgi:Glycosyltransferase family 87